MRAVLGAAVFKASPGRDLQQDWREGSAALSSVPVASPDVPLGPSQGAELGPEGDTQTHPPPPLLRPPLPRTRPCSEGSTRLTSSKPSRGSVLGAQSSAGCPDISGGVSPAYPARLPPWAPETGSDTFKVTQPVTGRTRLVAPPSHSQACGARRRSGGAPSGRSPDSGSEAGCAAPAPPGTGNEAPCPPHSAAAGGRTLEPGAVSVGTHRILQRGQSQKTGAWLYG